MQAQFPRRRVELGEKTSESTKIQTLFCEAKQPLDFTQLLSVRQRHTTQDADEHHRQTQSSVVRQHQRPPIVTHLSAVVSLQVPPSQKKLSPPSSRPSFCSRICGGRHCTAHRTPPLVGCSQRMRATPDLAAITTGCKKTHFFRH